MSSNQLKIRIPIDKEENEESTLFSYVSAELEDIRIGVYVYIFINGNYETYKINTDIILFKKTPGIITSFMFGFLGDPLKRVGMIDIGSKSVKIYDEYECIFIPLYKKVYHYRE